MFHWNRRKMRKFFLLFLSISTIFIIYQIYYYWQLIHYVKIDTIGQQIKNDSWQHSSYQMKVPAKENLSPSHVLMDIIGVAPSLLYTYTEAFNYKFGYFQCIHTKELIEREYFNDDYCDCLDGSDEPSTSACSSLKNIRFYCTSSCSMNQEHHFSIPYNRVNDGICDCCDGSDELKVSDISTNQLPMIISPYVTHSNMDSLKCFKQSDSQHSKH